MQRILVPFLLTLLVAGIYFAIGYALFVHVWPRLPAWANVVLVVALALAFVLTPMFLLLKLGNMRPPRT
ncbi:MAG: hypothetical protein GX093_08450 [Xanthomonadaceae bacterium]|nr:hypothetical protein [Xanthomonadaceae bacterium]